MIKTGSKKQPTYNYTTSAWEGLNYDIKLDLSEIAKIIKTELKRLYPETVFSITKQSYAGGQSLHVHLMKDKENPFVNEEDIDFKSISQNNYIRYGYDVESLKNLHKSRSKGNGTQLNCFYINDDWALTETAKEKMAKAKELANSFNFNDSDSMIDYFHTNFYLHLYIGKYGNAFKTV